MAEQFFKWNYREVFGKILHIINHSHVRCVVGPFDKKTTWRIYLDWTQSFIIFYPTNIYISSLCTSWYKVMTYSLFDLNEMFDLLHTFTNNITMLMENISMSNP